MQETNRIDLEKLHAVKSKISKFGATTVWGGVVLALWIASLIYDFIQNPAEFDLVSSLITLTIVFAIIFMLGHIAIVFVRELKSPFKTDYTAEFFRQERIRAGRPEEETEEEALRIAQLMDDAASSWTISVEGNEEEELYIPANAKELQISKAICNEIIAIAPTNPETVEILNGWLTAENDVRKRTFTGSYWLMGLAVAIGLILVFFVGSTPKENIGLAVLFFWIPAAVYFFAARAPEYLIAQRSNSQVSTGILAGAFAVIGSGAIIKTRWSDGATSEDSSGFWMSIVIGIFMLMACSLLIFPMACINYVRNYVINK